MRQAIGLERAADLLGGVGLEVEGLELAGAAEEVEEDHRLRPRPRMAVARRGLGREQPRQAQAEEPGAGGFEDFRRVIPSQAERGGPSMRSMASLLRRPQADRN